MEIVALPAALAAAISFFSPYLTSILTTTTMSSKAKNWIAFAVALVIGIGYVLFTGGITDFTDVGQIVQALTVSFTIQQLAYRQILVETATKVEAKYGIGSKKSFTSEVEAETTKAVDGSEVVIAETTDFGDVDSQAKG